jgi:hypothetical protein
MEIDILLRKLGERPAPGCACRARRAGGSAQVTPAVPPTPEEVTPSLAQHEDNATTHAPAPNQIRTPRVILNIVTSTANLAAASDRRLPAAPGTTPGGLPGSVNRSRADHA